MPGFGRSNVRAAKLTPQQVVQIRNLYDAGRTQRELCQTFNVSKETIGRIVRGESWRAYGGPGEHPGASRPTVEENLNEAALEEMISQPMTPEMAAAAEASLQATLAKLNMNLIVKPSEECTDDLPRQTNDLHSDDRRGEHDVPSHDVSEHQSGEEAEPVAGREPGTGPGR